MCTWSGVMRFMQEITVFVHKSTNMVANPIDKPFRALVVVAKVGHIPNNNTNVGFSLISPFSIILYLLISSYTLLYLLTCPTIAINTLMGISSVCLIDSLQECTARNG